MVTIQVEQASSKRAIQQIHQLHLGEYMKMNELQKRSKEELKQTLHDNRNELRNFRFQISQGKVKNNKMGREIKKTIARVLTRLHSIYE